VILRLREGFLPRDYSHAMKFFIYRTELRKTPVERDIIPGVSPTNNTLHVNSILIVEIFHFITVYKIIL